MKNLVILIGKVASDPVQSEADSKYKRAYFSLTTTETWKDKETGDPKSSTEFHQINGWNKIADIIINRVKKGQILTIFAKLKYRKVDKSGQQSPTVYANVEANEIIFMETPLLEQSTNLPS